METSECLSTLNGHTDWVCSVTWSPDGQKIASSSYDMTIKIWDAYAYECLSTLSGHTNSVQSVAWSPLLLGQKIASSSNDYEIKVWDIESYECKCLECPECPSTLSGHMGNVWSIVWSPLGQKIAGGGNRFNDYGIKIWDTSNFCTPYFNKFQFID